jgi:hypothetical protein
LGTDWCADTAHAVLGENTTCSPLYVATTRGRHTNTGYLYEPVMANRVGAPAMAGSGSAGVRWLGGETPADSGIDRCQR